MPIFNNTSGKTLPYRIFEANTFFTRLVGLLGTVKPDPKKAIHIVPCSSIHTFGMNYPIDIVFLNGDGNVISTVSRLKPNKILKTVRSASSVMELPAGAIEEHGIQKGELFRVIADGDFQTDLIRLGQIIHWPINGFIAFLWARFVYAAFNQWICDTHPLNLGILIHNTLLMYFFLMRRHSIQISSRFLDWIIPMLTLCGAMLLRPNSFAEHTLAFLSDGLQCIGITGIILSLLSLGKSFGIVPANRKIVCTGAYRLVRHPLYVSEILFYMGFLLSNVCTRNVLLVLMILAGQLYRSVSEENLLSRDPFYRLYQQKVPHRFIPGLF